MNLNNTSNQQVFIPFFCLFFCFLFFLFGKVGMSEWNALDGCSLEVSKGKRKKDFETLILLVLYHKHISSKIPSKKQLNKKQGGQNNLSNSNSSDFFSGILAAHLVIRSAWPMDCVSLGGHTLPIVIAERRPRATRAMAGLVEAPNGSSNSPLSCSF